MELNKNVIVTNLGITEYQSSWDLQRQIFELRVTNKIPDVLLINEHQNVYTLGKSADANHLLASKQELLTRNINLVNIDRGGDVTYHGPGQLVVYPILDLQDYYLDIHRYLRDLEEVIIRTLNSYGINGIRDNNYTGVWVGNDKIAAIGIKVSKWITMHGFALNVNTDLSYFDRIIPCGIFHKGVTSLEALLGTKINLNEVVDAIVRMFSEVFNITTLEKDPPSFLSYIHQLSSVNSECVLQEN